MADRILVGDIGGTNVRFACATRTESGVLSIDNVFVVPGDDFSEFGTALTAYLQTLDRPLPLQALLAFAGPVKNGVVTLTNRDWNIDSQKLAAEVGLQRVQLVNDYAAMARAVPELPDECFHTISVGELTDERQPVLVAGPGTGLGTATLLPVGLTSWRVLTGEGGHAAFAASTEREWALKEKLRESHGYVSKELVLSGSGLNAVHKALCDIDGTEYVEKPPAEMMALATQGDRICHDICEIRAGATMDALGDAALINGTSGGVVITGGVSERLVDWLEAPEAMQRFYNRGPMSNYMTAIPIRLLLSGEAALFGAAALYFDGENAA